MRIILLSTILLPTLAAVAPAQIPTRAVSPLPGAESHAASSRVASSTGATSYVSLPATAFDPPAMTRAWHDVDADGRFWVRGTTYKASVDTEGFTYVPFLGSDAVRIWPVHMRLVAVSRGGETIALEPASVTREGDRIVIDRGPVRVIYDVAVDSVEQSFAFDAVPSGAGDLVLHIETRSDLSGAASGRGIRFGGARGGVQFGEAFAVDTNGARLALDSCLVGDELRIVVPTAHVEAAPGPLLVDPLITTFTLDPFDAQHAFPDAAFDVSNDRWCFVIQEYFAGSDADIISWFVDGTTYQKSGFAFIDSSTDNWQTPAVASQNFHDVFCVTAATTSGIRNVVARYRDAVTGALATSFIIELGSAESPDVGGDSYAVSNDSYFMVVWQRRVGSHMDIVGVLLDEAGNFVGSKFDIAVDVGRSEQRPAISKSTGNPGLSARFNVAWIDADPGDDRGDVRCRQFSYNGVPTGAAFTVTSATNAAEVDVSSLLDLADTSNGEQYYLVTWDGDFTTDRDIAVATCSGDELQYVRALWSLEGTDFLPDQFRPSVAATDDQWIVAYVERLNSLAPNHVYGVVMDPVGDQVGVTESRVLYEVDGSSHVGLCSAYSGGAPASEDDVLATWLRRDGMNSDVIAGIHRTTSTRAAGHQYCDAAQNSTGQRGFIVATGDQGSTSAKTLVATRLPSHSLAFFLASRSSGYVANPGGSQGNLCLGGSIGRYSSVAASSGAAGTISLVIDPTAIQTPGGAIAAVPGDTWRFQAWHRDAVGGVATSNFTNAVAVPIE